MFRKLPVLFLLFIAANSFAQPGNTSQKQNDPHIDYKQTGTPMPVFRLLVYEEGVTNNTPDTSAPKKDKRKLFGNKHNGNDKSNAGDDKKTPQKILTNEDLDDGANLFIMMFNPTCSHCEDETTMLEKNIDLFKKSKIILVAAPGMQNYLGNFMKTMRIKDYPQITVGTDSAGFINEIFLYQALPQINIYSADRKLLKIYSGEASLDSLKKYIE